MANNTKPRRKSKAAGTTLSPKPKALSRRAMLGTVALYGFGGLAVLGGGSALAFDFRRKMVEGDLSRIGNGKPSLVQIHDPSCSMCRDLQRQARKALRECGADGLQFLVANIRSTDGAEFAASMGLPHVTLVFLDGAGNWLHTIRGITPSDSIKSDMSRVFG